MMLVRSLASELLPYEARSLLSSCLDGLRSRMSWRHTITIEQSDGWYTNRVFYAVKTYLAARVDTAGVKHLRLSGGGVDDDGDDEKLVFGMKEGEELVEAFQGAEFTWCLHSHDLPVGDPGKNILGGNGRRGGKLYFELSFHKRRKETALKAYVPFIVATTKAIRDRERPLTIYMNDGSDWSSMDLHHPSTFDTFKQSVIDDLDKFTRRKAYYKRIGKAWKRGYLLYGPPGTGKSSLIAAIANHLRFDIYDLELSGVDSNSQLRKLLLGMTNQSILVIEDIDCTIELKQRKKGNKKKPPKSTSKKDEKVTLSGLLNLVDGLWSRSGEERIIVFTTNYKECLDPALLRPGRMDMHIHMGCCTREAFRVLVSNYHSIDDHATYPEIDELMAEVPVTLAQVAETLMRSEDPDVALRDLIELLKSKRDGNNPGEEENADGDEDKISDDDDDEETDD
ncbi:putative mitochondrial chaperone BCS1-B [Panicum miliaceum]|uniref:Mitochondrial chaperone BCS1-B n=1 Tax=Panicum miliaceum TaxID=4540 RepID=A0A3L6Q694_PANMI|nr:putative mitochondrial chaperone BCS1-B [Panicum miliaceum]